MVEQSKQFRRKSRGRKEKSQKFLRQQYRSDIDIEAEDKALRDAFIWFDPEHLAELEFDEPVAAGEIDEELEQGPDIWSELPTIPVDLNVLERNLIITARRQNPSHAAFAVLRGRLFQTLMEKGWKRVAITSPTRDCGKSFVSVNLAIALSRYENCRTVLMDLDMRNPSISRLVGEAHPGSIGDYLRGLTPLQDHFFRFAENDLNIGGNLTIAMNDKVEQYASELLQEPATAECLAVMERALKPTVILFDLPPALAHDDVMAFRDNFDAVLVVIDGTRTHAAQVREVMRRLGEDCPLLGVVMNKAEDATGEEYGY
ncbi:MAG: CpsD/CapB family tyrosine-protein kinase [Thalassovita sp.]|nr:CpsD/CapB family tyrosine-protein kinase [Thalassovita sp.]